MTGARYEGILILTMRLEVIKSTPRIVFYLGLVGLLLLLLAISGKLNDATSNKKIVDTKVDPTQAQTLDEAEKEENSDDEEQETSSANSNTSSSSSTSAKFSVSINSHSTSGETTGSAKVEVTNNGNTVVFSDIFEECFSDGNIKIKIGDTKIDCESEDGNFEVDWNSKFKQKEENEYSSEINIDEKNSSD